MMINKLPFDVLCKIFYKLEFNKDKINFITFNKAIYNVLTEEYSMYRSTMLDSVRKKFKLSKIGYKTFIGYLSRKIRWGQNIEEIDNTIFITNYGDTCVSIDLYMKLDQRDKTCVKIHQILSKIITLDNCTYYEDYATAQQQNIIRGVENYYNNLRQTKNENMMRKIFSKVKKLENIYTHCENVI
jgi:hypothetical protein